MPAYDANTALIVVDLQNDFADPKGSLYVRGGEDVLAVANREIEAAQAAGATVVYTQDWHPPVTPHFVNAGGIWPVHCVADTWGAEFFPGLTIAGETIRKGVGGEDGYSGFTVLDDRTGEHKATRLDAMLKEHGIRRVVVLGLATDYCVKQTALDALRLGYETSVLNEGVRAVNLQWGDGERALQEIRDAGGSIV